MAKIGFGESRIFGDEEVQNLQEVLASQMLWRAEEGRFSSEFEDRFGQWLGREYVLALSSGTAANEAALVGCGIGPGDEVICPPCSFIASSMSALAVGAVPVFADVDPRSLLITAERLEKAVTPNARAVVVVHLGGNPADMDPILQVARAHNLAVIEDCAQAYGPTYKGTKAGTLGDCACFSLQQGKMITAGEGGMIATDDPDVYKRAMLYSNCGMPWYRHELPRPVAEPLDGVPTRGHFALGHNYRMTELQAAVAVAQLERLEHFNAARRSLAAIIHDHLDDVSGLQMPYVHPEAAPIYWNFWIQSIDMPVDELNRRLRSEYGTGVGRYSEINYLEAVFQEMDAQRQTPLGLPLPDYVRYNAGLCPDAEAAARRAFGIWTHHAVAPETLKSQLRAIRRIMMGV